MYFLRFVLMVVGGDDTDADAAADAAGSTVAEVAGEGFVSTGGAFVAGGALESECSVVCTTGGWLEAAVSFCVTGSF